ncbi:FAD:protein FMN transferase [Aliiroseovarius sp. KMU-50]|uniref:FAD:protein FMN transferase n=1 Tax=Aliiroseovarius salicola TaxID=3009082 RepID=A0ABT4VY73_9RHOB|nr:FAD:protein FMN transferase [Aliiroseovarius sp. KMU-50]MDA5093124.1 FAD:protein FMN transferase [Aliiroseovarius sp. KMU-50]
MTSFNRRRFLAVTAAASLLPGGASASVARWNWHALGGPVSMQLSGMSDADAQPIFAAVEAELTRLEEIFSLYRTTSEVSRLNRDKRLENPSPELLHVLSLCDSLHQASAGAFDPTIQPLWQAYAKGGDPEAVKLARSQLGWDQLRFDTNEVRLTREGALTLNGIAQGEITDRIVVLLKDRGLQDVLVDMGEIAAVGHGPKGPWSIGVALPDGTLVHRLTASDRAVATSVPTAMTIGGDQPHILSPMGHAPVQHLVSVSASKAAVADGLSTALCLMDIQQTTTAIHAFPDARIEIQKPV